MKKALISGANGQDGSYLCEQLLIKGYAVHGIIRRSSSPNTSRIDHILDDIQLHDGDLTDSSSLNKIVQEVKPDEIFNLAAQSHVKTSFNSPSYTSNVDALGCLRFIEVAHQNGVEKFYQASTSELFGTTPGPQNEETPFNPCSPYAIAKRFAFDTVVNYRDSYGMFAVNGILFNHESPRRGEHFVSKKICKGLVRIKNGLQDKLFLGNIEARRDWGYAPDFTYAMWTMLQQNKPEDFVIATGESHTVKEFLDEAGANLDMDWTKYVAIDLQFYRPVEVDYLLGDYSKAKRLLGWQPKVRFKELVRIMCDHEMNND